MFPAAILTRSPNGVALAGARVAVPVDGSMESAALIGAGLVTAAALHAQLELVHVAKSEAECYAIERELNRVANDIHVPVRVVVANTVRTSGNWLVRHLSSGPPTLVILRSGAGESPLSPGRFTNRLLECSPGPHLLFGPNADPAMFDPYGEVGAMLTGDIDLDSRTLSMVSDWCGATGSRFSTFDARGSSGPAIAPAAWRFGLSLLALTARDLPNQASGLLMQAPCPILLFGQAATIDG
ncbi:MAG: hypothetical protein ACI8Y4_002423 [Candidatus Poriferisodalaceae bacterium]|jgi:hypothetical protein